MIATITLNPSIDQTLEVENLVKDDANRALSITRTAGGKGLNVSKVVRELGGPTHAYGLLGGFTGRYWRRLVEELDVPFTAWEVEGETRVNTVVTDLEDRTQTRISAPGPCVPSRDAEKFLRRLLRVRPKPAFWALGGSLPKGTDPGLVYHYVERLQKNGTPCLLDADGDALKEGMRAKPYAAKPNEHEIQRLMGRRLSGLRAYRDAAAWLLSRGVAVAIVSLGADGAIFATGGERFHAPGIPVRVKSKVGAGDSLIGGFLLGLHRGRSVREAAALGMAASASAVTREAPRLCRRADVPKLRARVRFRAV
jgi:1-phosphofructokinase